MDCRAPVVRILDRFYQPAVPVSYDSLSIFLHHLIILNTLTGCLFNLDRESPKYPPHLIDSKTRQIIQPVLVENKRIITLSPGQQVTVACIGSNNVVVAANRSVINSAECNSPTLRIGSKSLTYPSLGCKNQVKETIKEIGPCSTDGTLVEIGWQIESSFIKQLTVCHQRTTANTLYSSNVILGKSILADDESNKRPSFRRAGFFNGIDVDKAYSQVNQIAVLTQILNSASLARRYINNSKSYFFSRGHLAPDGDFIDAASQDSTYYYINCAPQWQSFNNGNWKALELAVRNLAAERKSDYTIYTGTFGTMTLADERGQQKPIYLAEGQLIPVPKYFWKVIYDTKTKKATAVVGINNPHIATVTGADIFCPDVCNQVPWIKFDRTRIAAGYTFCCSVRSLHNIISYSPNLGNLPLLA